jgi:hypothetical protein
MSQAKAVKFQLGLRTRANDLRAVYAQIKNGNVYRLNQMVTSAEFKALSERVAQDNTIHLTNWTLARHKA